MNFPAFGTERCITRQVSGPVFYTRQVRAQNAADQNLANIRLRHRNPHNRVFIIPANRDFHVDDEEFHLKPISKPRGWPDVITVFLRSLTEHWEDKLIAVVVSGYDGDGAAALCGIKEVGGITIAQKLSTASQPDMPNLTMSQT